MTFKPTLVSKYKAQGSRRPIVQQQAEVPPPYERHVPAEIAAKPKFVPNWQRQSPESLEAAEREYAEEPDSRQNRFQPPPARPQEQFRPTPYDQPQPVRAPQGAPTQFANPTQLVGGFGSRPTQASREDENARYESAKNLGKMQTQQASLKTQLATVEEPICVLKVELDGEHIEEIKIFENDDPSKIVHEFGLTFNLSDNACARLLE